jgi:hypothetical protein
MDLYNALAVILKDEMNSKGYSVPPSAISDQIVDGYLNLINRQIKPSVRVFSESAELVVPTEQTAGYRELRRKVEAGELLKPHQSTSIETPDYYDSLFLDWGIQHFHLGTHPHPRERGFVARSGPLLFARVTPSHFYAIQVYGHGAWNKNEIMEILDRNWPAETAPFKLKGLRALTAPHSDQEIKSLRAAGVTVLAQVAGALLAPIGGGFRSNGDSSLVLNNRANLIANCEEIEASARPLLEEFASHGGPPLDRQSVGLERRAGKLTVVEKSTNTDICEVEWLIKKDLQ